MRRVYTFIGIVCISLGGVVALAQPWGDGFGDPPGNGLSSPSAGTTADPAGTAGQLIEIAEISEQLLAVDVVVPEVNQAVAETIDSKTKRYLPRLKIYFAEFPLRSLESGSLESAGRSGVSTTRAEGVARRIERRLRTAQLELVVQDRNAVLSGTVSSERQRSLAESMLRFEPGIDAVQNNLVVAP